MASAKVPSRPLSERERSIIDALLELDFPGAAELRAQVARTEVIGGWPDRWPYGCPAIDLWVPEDVTPSPDWMGRSDCLPAEALVDTTEHTTLQVQLFVRDGRLSALETPWIDGETPSEWPSVDRLEVFIRGSGDSDPEP
jgi:hypothetical protein